MIWLCAGRPQFLAIRTHARPPVLVRRLEVTLDIYPAVLGPGLASFFEKEAGVLPVLYIHTYLCMYACVYMSEGVRLQEAAPRFPAAAAMASKKFEALQARCQTQVDFWANTTGRQQPVSQ